MIAASSPEVLTPAAPGDPFRASVISSACALNELNATLPAPLNFPSSGSAAWTSHRRGGGQLLNPGAGVAFGMAAAEQAGEGAVRGFGERVVVDVQQHDLLFRCRAGERGVHACGPGALGDPDDDARERRSRFVRCRWCAASPTGPGWRQGAWPVRSPGRAG